jgi:DNA-binding transcriptional regulator YiaG
MPWRSAISIFLINSQIEGKPMNTFAEKAKAKHKKMSEHLKVIRTEEGLTMRSVASEIGTPHSFIGKIEGQERRLDIAEFVLYCEGMNRDPVAVFKALVKL